MTFTLPSDASPQLRLAVDLVTAVPSGNVERAAEIMDDDLKYQMVAPSCEMGWGKVESLHFAKACGGKDGATGPMKDFTNEVLDYCEMPGKVWLFVQGTSTLTKTNEPYNNRYIFMYDFATRDDKLKVVNIREFSDTQLLFKSGIFQ